MCCRTRKNNQIQQNLQENEENLAIFGPGQLADLRVRLESEQTKVELKSILTLGYFNIQVLHIIQNNNLHLEMSQTRLSGMNSIATNPMKGAMAQT